jgi:hypothetical protein
LQIPWAGAYQLVRNPAQRQSADHHPGAAESAEHHDRQSKYYGPNCGGIDNQEGYLDCTATIYFGAYDKQERAALHHQLHLNFQWQPTNDMSFTIGYTGNRGRHAVIPIPANEPGIATPAIQSGVKPRPTASKS